MKKPSPTQLAVLRHLAAGNTSPGSRRPEGMRPPVYAKAELACRLNGWKTLDELTEAGKELI